MNEFCFEPFEPPFPLWIGPYSPARGTHFGFRFNERRLGTWVKKEGCLEFWTMFPTVGVKKLECLVLNNWGGGRILLLPDGHVIKPLQEEWETGKRVVIGKFSGDLLWQLPDGEIFDMNDLSDLSPGDPWPGPNTIGLECIIQWDGSLVCKWNIPCSWGSDIISVRLYNQDWILAKGFRLARRGKKFGRVRVIANGIIITNDQLPNGEWQTKYVGKIDTNKWTFKPEWFYQEED